MTLTKENLAILGKFDFDVQPVVVKFLGKRPNMVERLAENMAFCEMLKRAQEGSAFFADAKNHTCEAGLYVLGQADSPEPFISGECGAGLQIFEEPRSASRLYHHIPKIGRGVIHYVAFSPLEKLSFNPDLLILLANTEQTEFLLRAMSYRTGEMWESKFTAAIGCAWTREMRADVQSAGPQGTRIITSVPWPGTDLSVRRPPANSARSRMLTIPRLPRCS